MSILPKDVSANDWQNWRWQMRNSIRDAAALAKYVDLTDDEKEGLEETKEKFRLGISPYYLSLIDRDHRFCPVRMQVIPRAAEALVSRGELVDPLGEDKNRPVSCVVHKYPDRVLFLAGDVCPIYCRHCTRRRITKGGEANFGKTELEKGFEYVRAHPEVRDVIVSGGDPLILSSERLEEILSSLSEISHVEMVRIGTRVPVCLPMRIDDALAKMLRRYAPVYVITHFNHPKEVTPEAQQACERLVDHGVPVENQMVLMRRINSSARIVKELSHACLKMRVRPYYMHQLDVAEGLEHLRTPIQTGIDIISKLRGHTSGLAVPHLAVDLPGGGGKITVQPQYMVRKENGNIVFSNYLGRSFEYPETSAFDVSCPYEEVWRDQNDSDAA